MRAVLVALVLLAVVVAPASAKVPSVALWMASENNHEDSLINPVVNKCETAFSKDDQHAGECAVRGLIGIYPGLNAYWARGLARIAKPQRPVCKRALHAYYLAARKNFSATLSYFRAHRHIAATDLQRDLSKEPYLTLGNLKDEAKSKAVRICG